MSLSVPRDIFCNLNTVNQSRTILHNCIVLNSVQEKKQDKKAETGKPDDKAGG